MTSRPTVPPVESLRSKGSPLPQFFAPETEPAAGTWTSSPSDLPATDPSTGWGSPQLQEDVLDEAPPSAGPTSSRGSSGKDLLGEIPVADLTRSLVIGTGEFLHEELARDEAAQSVELWLADDVDAMMIGDPLASIIERRVPKDVMGNADAGDMVVAMVGVAMYGLKQFNRWRQARRIRRAARAAAATAEATEQPAEPAPGPAAAPASVFPYAGSSPTNLGL